MIFFVWEVLLKELLSIFFFKDLLTNDCWVLPQFKSASKENLEIIFLKIPHMGDKASLKRCG